MRQTVPHNMNDKRTQLVGIEIGGTKLQVAVSDNEGTIKQQLRYTVDPTAGAAGIQAQLQKSLAQIGIETIAAIGVGFGGPVDWKTGIIQTSHQVEGWAQYNLKAWLEEFTGAPVAVENDANVAALAEATNGAGKGYNPVFYMTIGSGIGGGLVLDNSIFHGAIPGEVEIGHVRLSKNGNTLESECSGWAVNKKVRAYIALHPHSLLAQRAASHHGPEAQLLQYALEKGDAHAKEIMAAVADDLAFALSHVVHLFHPQMLILGGGLSLLGEALRQPIAERLPYYVMKAFHPVPKIALAALRENVVPVGALQLAKQIHQQSQQKKTA
jgi:glucokinase